MRDNKPRYLSMALGCARCPVWWEVVDFVAARMSVQCPVCGYENGLTDAIDRGRLKSKANSNGHASLALVWKRWTFPARRDAHKYKDRSGTTQVKDDPGGTGGQIARAIPFRMACRELLRQFYNRGRVYQTLPQPTYMLKGDKD